MRTSWDQLQVEVKSLLSWPRALMMECSAGVTLREWSGDEEALSLDYAVQTPSHFTMILYLKFMCTDSNDRVYP